MKYAINDQLRLMRPPEGPLAAHIRPFSNWVSERGYARCSLRQRIRLAAMKPGRRRTQFDEWLREQLPLRYECETPQPLKTTYDGNGLSDLFEQLPPQRP